MRRSKIVGLGIVVALAIACLYAPTPASAQSPAFMVNGNIGLQSFVSLTDAHVRETLDSLTGFAATAEARSGNWREIEAPLRAATSRGVPATIFYADAKGTYWVIGKGLQHVTVADRPYFAKVMSGSVAIGDLIVGRSSGKVGTVVAVPVRGTSGKVIGLVGASVDLAQLNAILIKEMGIGSNVVFWATNSRGITALHNDAANLFNDALKVPDIQKVLKHMIDTDSGTETYLFRGKMRTVLFRHSTLTGWTYGFGLLH